jgi:hypothetical protein
MVITKEMAIHYNNDENYVDNDMLRRCSNCMITCLKNVTFSKFYKKDTLTSIIFIQNYSMFCISAVNEIDTVIEMIGNKTN